MGKKMMKNSQALKKKLGLTVTTIGMLPASEHTLLENWTLNYVGARIALLGIIMPTLSRPHPADKVQTTPNYLLFMKSKAEYEKKSNELVKTVIKGATAYVLKAMNNMYSYKKEGQYVYKT